MRVGVLGGGQLGRMLALAGYRLGLECRLLDPDPDACAGQVAELYLGDLSDSDTLSRFADGLDVATIEWENVPVASAELLAQRLPFYPPPKALEVAQDRLLEKDLFVKLGIETAAFVPVDSPESLATAVEHTGLPAVLKTRRLGYDGKGQWRISCEPEIAAVAAAMTAPCILERFVAFQRELSIISVRSATGETGFYPLVENHHRDGILRVSYAPAPDVSTALQARAEAIAMAVMERLDYVGVMAIELFQAGDELIANEIAPRVHNSGHWTIDGAITSQFENHLRAICGLPLGSTRAVAASAMINLIGSMPPLPELLSIPGARVHCYGKEPRPGRKLGHVNFVEADSKGLQASVARLAALIEAQEAVSS